MKYYIIGPYPPPLGGVSVYIYRYKKKLEKDGCDVEVINTSSLSKVKRLVKYFCLALIPWKIDIQLNTYDYIAMVAMLLRPFSTHSSFYNHGYNTVENECAIKKVILKKFFNKVNECIYVGTHLVDEYQKKGFITDSSKTKIQPAFLPPPLEEEQIILNTYDSPTRDFVENHKPLIIANAYRISFYNNTDLYGLDMCVELISRISSIYMNAGLLFALADIGCCEYFDQICKRIDEYKIANNVHFMTGQKELWPLFKRADLMVRPTCIDGYPVSIAEALYFGCPTVASDVCLRPEKTIVFKNRNSDDFVSKCIDVLENKP